MTNTANALFAAFFTFAGAVVFIAPTLAVFGVVALLPALLPALLLAFGVGALVYREAI